LFFRIELVNTVWCLFAGAGLSFAMLVENNGLLLMVVANQVK